MNIFIAFSEDYDKEEIKRIVRFIKGYVSDKKNSIIVKRVPLNGLHFWEPIIKIVDNDNKFRFYKNIKITNIETILSDFVLKKFKHKNLIKRSEEKIYLTQRKILSDFGENLKKLKNYISVNGYFFNDNPNFLNSQSRIRELIEKNEYQKFNYQLGNIIYKLNIIKKNRNRKKYVVCNLMENYFSNIDKTLVDSNPHKILEGVLIASYIIGAEKAFLLVDLKERDMFETLQKSIGELIDNHIVGKNSKSGLKSIIIKKVPGFLLLYEKKVLSSLLKIENRNLQIGINPIQNEAVKDIFVSDAVNFVNLANILKGEIRIQSTVGTFENYNARLIALYGDIKRRGIFEINDNISLSEIILKYGESELFDIKAIQIGGILGKVISSKDSKIKYKFNNLLQKLNLDSCEGTITIFNREQCMVDYAKYLSTIFQIECCGKCNIGRVGTKRAYEIISDISNGKADIEKFRILKKLLLQIQLIAKCNFGKKVAMSLMSLIDSFKNEFKEHIEKKVCLPLQCSNLIKYKIDDKKCNNCKLCMEICPVKAIIKKDKIYFIDNDLCVKCDACYQICESGSIIKYSEGVKNDKY